MLVAMMPQYIRAVLAGDPWGMMLLSFIDSPITLTSWSNSFTHGRATGHLWDSPFIRFSPTADGLVETSVDRYVLRVLQVSLPQQLLTNTLLSCLPIGCLCLQVCR